MSQESVLIIKQAFLSVKNIECVYSQIKYDMENIYRLDIYDFYKEYTKSMMEFIFKNYNDKLTNDHINNGKKTIILLNAISIKRIFNQVVSQNKDRIKNIMKKQGNVITNPYQQLNQDLWLQ